jgi:hypothetical protein
MKSRAAIFRMNGDACERAAARVADPQIQASYQQMSRQWHEMAERQLAIEDALVHIGKSIELGSAGSR